MAIASNLSDDGYIHISRHARKRMRQRGIPGEALMACLALGRRTYESGICFIWLRGRDIPAELGHAIARFEGVVALLGGREIITVYRLRRGRKIGRAGRGWERR